MIYRSYLVEEKIDIIKKNFILFYGENIGLINDLKTKIRKHYKNSTIINFAQDEILKNENLFYDEINNNSLFGEEKIFFILDTTEKIFKFVENISLKKINNKVFFFAKELEKKSKLRNLFENDKNKIIIPCYKDNDSTIKNIIKSILTDYSGLTSKVISIIQDTCSNDRIKLNNEILKIKTFFIDKQIKLDSLQKLLNIKEEDDFNLLRDSSLLGKNLKTNELLNNDTLEREKIPLYIALVNQRLKRLRELEDKDPHEGINNLKPPIFWKDKPVFLQQSKIWNKRKLNLALTKSYDVEIKIKSNPYLNKETIFKKFLIDICCLANAA